MIGAPGRRRTGGACDGTVASAADLNALSSAQSTGIGLEEFVRAPIGLARQERKRESGPAAKVTLPGS